MPSAVRHFLPMSTHTISLSFQMHVHDSHPALPGSHNIFSHIAIFPNKYLVHLISCSCLLAPYRTWVKTAFLSSLCRRTSLVASFFLYDCFIEWAKLKMHPVSFSLLLQTFKPTPRTRHTSCMPSWIHFIQFMIFTRKNTKSIKMSRLNKIGICLYNYKP